MPGTASLLPKEHGAYAQLAFPLVTGMALAMPTLSTITLGLAGVAFFLANEPAAILLGGRGVRLRKKEGPRAKVRGESLSALGVALGGLGVVTGWPSVWPSVLLPSLAGLFLVPLVLTGRQKTLPGEILVITTFTTLILPMAAASGVNPTRAALASAVWWVSFVLATLEVRAIKARHKGTALTLWTRWVPQITSGAVAAGAVLLALGQGGYPELAGPAAALLPPALATFILSLFRVHPKYLKRVGWSVVVANTLALVLLLQG
jgi:hypothetical protein